MKFIVSLIFIAFALSSFSQTKSKVTPKKKSSAKIIRDQNNVSGNQTINNNYNYNGLSKAQIREKEIAATTGEFGKQKDALIADSPYFRWGSNASGEMYEAFRFGNEPVDLFRVARIKGQYYIAVTFRDCKGDEIANILGRTWHVTNTQSIEYNNDKSGFEITTSGRVILQLDIRKGVVVFNGMVCTGNGSCTFIMPNSSFQLPVNKSGTQRFNLPNDFILKPLFMYPRSKFLGVRIK